jgi:hypothetical protein
MPAVTVFVGTKLYNLTGQITDKNGDPVDLTGATLTLFVGNIGDTPLINGGTIVVTDAELGTYSYEVQEDDLSTAGHYEAQIHVLWDTGKLMVGDTFDFIVRAKLGD